MDLTWHLHIKKKCWPIKRRINKGLHKIVVVYMHRQGDIHLGLYYVASSKDRVLHASDSVQWQATYVVACVDRQSDINVDRLLAALVKVYLH